MDATQRFDSDKQLEAMKLAIESMKVNDMQTLVDPPEEIKPIGCKWVFKRKRGADGKAKIYENYLVTKGYHQCYGIDYDEIFSPVAMLKSIQIMLVIAAHMDNEIQQIDVKITFLNGELKEEMYMIQFEGFISTDESKVYKLRSIYGLKQASRSWNMHFDKVIRTYDFIRNKKESYIYKWINDSMVVFLILYVDDILLSEMTSLYYKK